MKSLVKGLKQALRLSERGINAMDAIVEAFQHRSAEDFDVVLDLYWESIPTAPEEGITEVEVFRRALELAKQKTERIM